MQLLGVLRVLGRATCFDGIEELTEGSAEIHRTFFHDFCKRFACRYFEEYVHPPRTVEELRKMTSVYDRQGLTGAVGSVDCVHCRWDQCPATLLNLHTGKEGYPTLAWEVTVDHHMRAMAVTKGFCGSYNDKTISKYDSYLHTIQDSQSMFGQMEYKLFNEHGTVGSRCFIIPIYCY